MVLLRAVELAKERNTQRCTRAPGTPSTQVCSLEENELPIFLLSPVRFLCRFLGVPALNSTSALEFTLLQANPEF